MKRMFTFAAVLLVASFFATAAFAGDKADRKTSAEPNKKELSREARQQMRAERKEARKATSSALRISGEELAANLEKIESELTWYDSFETGIKAAEKADKPLFLLNVLGDRCGHV